MSISSWKNITSVSVADMMTILPKLFWSKTKTLSVSQMSRLLTKKNDHFLFKVLLATGSAVFDLHGTNV